MDMLQNMEEMLECRICLCLLDDPKGLKCQHSFCKDCLDDTLEFKPNGSASLKCIMKCEGIAEIQAEKTTSELGAPYQLKAILDMYKAQHPISTSIDKLCKGKEDCKADAVLYCLLCYNLFCNQCKCKEQEHVPSHTPVRYVEKYNQLMPICKTHNAVAKYVCCGDKLICVYCRNREHASHNKNEIPDQTRLVQDILGKLLSPKEDGDKERLERLKVQTINNRNITKVTIDSLRVKLGQVLKVRTLKYALHHMSVASHQSKNILRLYDQSTAAHLDKYPEDSTYQTTTEINEIMTDKQMNSQQQFIKNKYTNYLDTVPILNVSMSSCDHERNVGELNIKESPSTLCVSASECCSSVDGALGGVDEDEVKEEVETLIQTLNDILQGMTDESEVIELLDKLSLNEDDSLTAPPSYESVATPSAPPLSEAAGAFPFPPVVPPPPMLKCPLCGSMDIPDSIAFLDHLIALHEVELPSEGADGTTVEIPQPSSSSSSASSPSHAAATSSPIRLPHRGDRVLAQWGQSQYFTATIVRYDATTKLFEIDWDDGDTTGREVEIKNLSLDRIPGDHELQAGVEVLFTQGSYTPSTTQLTGGKRWHRGVITEASTDWRGKRLYNGHHTFRGWNFRGYSHEFKKLAREDLRIRYKFDADGNLIP